MEGGGGATPAAVADKRQKSLPVEIATATAKNGLFGAALGDLFSRIPPKTPVISARSCAVFGGVYGGTMCAMRQITGKDDTKNIMVAGFTSGFMFHLVGRMPSRPRVPAAVGTGLFVSVSYGLIHEHVCLYIYLDTGHQIE
ncbi:chloroplastic import inner membrane translocase subunit HP30-2-like isoform X2 [Papaver somniferum]|nr:chloroplastic import inner membrane translocase subunit HP30-2-like isoform X2 [Papaver somniferum]